MLENLLLTDLSKEKFENKKISSEDAKKFIGGSGLAAKVIYDGIDFSASPLSPENPLVFMCGPLTGTKSPTSGRYSVCARSPLTNIWGEANSGGSFGPYMRFSGYDGIVIRGRSERLSYLLIDDGKAELRDASHLAGKGTYETQRSITGGDRKTKVACIGLAGENLVKYAAIMNDDGRAAGRCGLGAVMGSKNLKAIAVRGERKIKLAEREKFEEAAKNAHKSVKKSGMAGMYAKLGTSGYVELAENNGDLSIKYYTQGKFPGASKISGTAMLKILTRNARCYGCPIGCGRKIRVDAGKYGTGETEGPEYETIGTFGSLCMNDNLEAICHANYLCNNHGLDTISCGISIAFAFFLYEKGRLTKEETGMELKWGDANAVTNLVDMIASRRGIGNTLAEGTRAMEQKYGMSGYAAQVKGLEVPMHDPRAFFSMACEYATSPRGACHLQGSPFMVEMGSAIKEYDMMPSNRFADKGKGVLTARNQDFMAIYHSAIICVFAFIRPQMVAELLAHATGNRYSMNELLVTGERINNLKRAFNARCGATRADDKLPQILLQPLPEGGTKGKVPDVEAQLKEYYEYRKWDAASGKPQREKLVELGLESVAGDLWG